MVTPLSALVLAFAWGGLVARHAGHVPDAPLSGANLEGLYAAIGRLGDPEIALTIGVLALIAARQSWRAVLLWILALGVGGGLEHVTKVVTDSGYPSGHTFGAVMVATVLASMGRPGLLLGAGWIAAMGVTQMAVGAHLPIDVIGGLALGGVIGAGWWLSVGLHLEVVEVAEAEHAGEFVQRGAALD